MGHDSGVKWIRMLNMSFDFLEMKEGINYIRLNMTTFGFSTYEDANNYYMVVLNGMAQNSLFED
jgi:hypothetical protein